MHKIIGPFGHTSNLYSNEKLGLLTAKETFHDIADLWVSEYWVQHLRSWFSPRAEKRNQSEHVVLLQRHVIQKYPSQTMTFTKLTLCISSRAEQLVSTNIKEHNQWPQAQKKMSTNRKRQIIMLWVDNVFCNSDFSSDFSLILVCSGPFHSVLFRCINAQFIIIKYCNQHFSLIKLRKAFILKSLPNEIMHVI